MATSRSFYEYIFDTLSQVGDVTFRPMMGEYLIYYKGTLVGGIYDDRLLVKPTASAVALLPKASYTLPYEGAKEMLLVEDPEGNEGIRALFEGIVADLPKKKK